MIPSQNIRVSVLGIASALLALCPSHSHADTSSDLRAFTGAPTRMVWIQDAGPLANVYSEHPTIKLMGLDTEDGKGERPILPDIGWYAKPLLTSDGKRVVFANIATHAVEVVNFDGTGRRVIFKNDDAYKFDPKPFIDDAVWTDPQTGTTWVYAMMMESRAGQQVPAIRRFQLDHPEKSELVWDKSPAYMFMLSGDGRIASGGPVDGGNSLQGMFTLPNGTFVGQHNGCWPSMSPDASHRMWVFQGSHRGIILFTPANRSGSMTSTTFNFPAPGLSINGGDETYHPRWTNNVQFLVMDAPFPHKAWNFKSDTKIPEDVAANVEIYLGKFNDTFTGIDKWMQVTQNHSGNYWPNVWIKPSQADLDALVAATKTPGETITVAPSPKGLVYTWLNGGAGNQITDPVTGNIRQCNGQLKGDARFARGYAMDLTDGSFVPDAATDPLLNACKASGQFALEADITPTGTLSQAEQVIMAFASDPANGNFVLAQQGDTLTLRLKTDSTGSSFDPIKLGTLTQSEPNHVVISYANGRLSCFINGREAIIPNTLSGGLSNWTAQPLIFGDSANGGHNWPGTLQDINLFSRDISAGEAHGRFVQERGRTKAVTPVEPLVVDAKLTVRCPPADPAQIAPYRRCLGVQLYEIEKVVSGTCPDKKISVAQWSILDAKAVPAYAKLAAGQTYRLVLEKMDDHPEQESERTFNGDFDPGTTDLYYEVRPPVVLQTASASPAPESAPPAPGTVTITDPAAADLTSKGDVQLAGHGSVVTGVVTDLGSEYTEAPAAQFSGGGGKGTAGIATLGVTSLNLTGVGGSYTSDPTVVISQPDIIGGIQATATAALIKDGDSIADLTVTNPGTGYLRLPQITFTGGGGSGAEAHASMALTSVIITNGGCGYTTPPAVTLSGGGGQNAAAQAALAFKTIRYTTPDAPCLFTNSGTIGQDGATLVFDWAAPTLPTTKSAKGFINNGTWTLKNGSQVRFASSTGFSNWEANGTSNSGTMRILDRSGVGCTVFGNSGLLELGPGAILGQSEYAALSNAIYNGNKGEIDVIGGTRDQPAIFGLTAPEGTGRRDIENDARLIIGSGRDSSGFTIAGGFITVKNGAHGDIEIKPGARLSLLTNDNGATTTRTTRDAKIINAGNFLLAGQLRLQANFNGFLGWDNTGKITIQGDQAEVEHMPNSAASDDFYDSARGPTQILNEPGGLVQGVGALTYTNSTGSDAGHLMKIFNQGTIAPGEAASGQSPEAFGPLALHNANIRFGGFAYPPPPPGVRRDTLPPPVASKPPKPGTLRIGIAGPPNTPGRFDSLTLTGTGEVGQIEFVNGDGNTLNIVPAAGYTPHGTYRIVTATAISGAFETLQYNGSPQAPYTVNYKPDGIEAVFP